jgi:hypothetical protein
MTPKRIVGRDLGSGYRRIVLACRCATVGRHYPSDVSDADALAELIVDHRRTAPLCRHPAPPIGATGRP